MKNRKSVSVVILVASLLLAVTFMDTWILFTQTHRQTRESGIYQLESISGKLEATISDAESLTMELALKAREYLENREALKAFIYSQKEELVSGKIGAFNLYIAGPDFVIIPDFDIPEDYVVTERVWYTGAMRGQGKTYVSSPYQDAMTGEICYSTSVLLGDGETVLGVDYTMENIQEYIAQIYDGGSSNAVIVTGEGIIAGCANQELIGKRLVSALPDYAGIYSSAKNKSGVATGRIKADFLYENLFAARAGNGWYLIVSESDWALYKNSYIQLMITLVLSLALFSIIIVLYLMALRSQTNAEAALASKEEFLAQITGEFHEPLKRILDKSDRENRNRLEDYEMELAAIHAAGEKLSEMVNQIMSYTSIVRSEKKGEKRAAGKTGGMNKRFRTVILAFMILVMLVSLYTNVSATYRWGNVLMQSEAQHYEYQLSEWINTQKSILDMFVSNISTHPEMLEDYEKTVSYLNEITIQYPEISVTYMTNPDFSHTVYMNNGWEPDENWHVEERQWYQDTLASETGWNISAPYYDEQTGSYCVTISETVYHAGNGEFLGIFGIDFFMDKLVDILGDSYTDSGYAFLVDPEGEIINHPYGSYQMTQDSTTNISSLAYGEIRADGATTQLIKDYDGTWKILIAIRNTDSNFTVYVVSSAEKIYGNVFLYGIICLIAFLTCIVLVYRLLTDLIKWQDKTNQQMKDAADAAIAAGKAKSQFLAQMSHEIRTPINAVLGMNEMILRETKDENILDYAGNIQSAGRTLLSLINSILDFSKIEDGKMELVPVRYDVSSMVNDLVNSIAERAKAKELGFDVQVDETLPSELYGDDVRIRQVIMNLLTNAVKYTEKGKVTLELGNGGMQESAVLLQVSVKDTGIGIRKEDMGRLFESFERLEEKRNRNIEGTGLGMSIVTKLLAMMGSKLQVESVYGEGSAFSFELKQEVVTNEPIGNLSERLMRKQELPSETYLYAQQAKILVVDDNEMNRKVTKNLMKRNGITADLAVSGAEAIEMIRNRRYDIVFLDHMMPKMDGIETLKKLKEENLVHDGCTIIALTANAVSGARERYIEAGFDDYLSKPIEVGQLEEKLKAYLPEEIVEWRTEGKNPAKSLADASGRKAKPAAETSGKQAKPTAETSGREAKPVAETKGKPEGAEASKISEEILEFSPEKLPESGNQEYNRVNPDDGKDGLLKKLAEAGFEAEAGLAFCGGELAFYEEVLADYVSVFPEKKKELDGYYQSGSWHDFEILAHAVKSSSKTVGAMKLSERALSLEEAAKKEDAEYICSQYAGFMAAYGQAVETIKICLLEAKT
ncbi:MAG: response regulator [Lachnospiraceae bacterium]|nr:response regulator [Lachnospiraceae bacterium]